jgi:MoaA/NifB/PqqE/SkfB family radical SAM enzyme
MAGAMAGSAILAASDRSSALSIVTLTVNNSCNLACPHCYLQYSGPGGLASASVIDAVLASSCAGISIVGKEPLANRASVALVREIVERADEAGKWVSLITNGLNASLLPLDLAAKFAWIDVSLDGGAATYERYRRGSWEKLARSLAMLRHDAGVDLRLLQTLSQETVTAVDEMIDVGVAAQATMTIFSPFQPTRSTGTQSARAIDPDAYLSALEPHRNSPHDFRVTMDALYAHQFAETKAVERGVNLFADRFVYVSDDPIDRGLIRVTYDGLALSPFASVNTADYGRAGIRVGSLGLDAVFRQLQADAAEQSLH